MQIFVMGQHVLPSLHHQIEIVHVFESRVVCLTEIKETFFQRDAVSLDIFDDGFESIECTFGSFTVLLNFSLKG